MIAKISLLLLTLVTCFDPAESFYSRPLRLVRSTQEHFSSSRQGDSSEATIKAMEAARNCAASGLSPGAGLATAEEQAEVWMMTYQILVPIHTVVARFFIRLSNYRTTFNTGSLRGHD